MCVGHCTKRHTSGFEREQMSASDERNTSAVIRPCNMIFLRVNLVLSLRAEFNKNKMKHSVLFMFIKRPNICGIWIALYKHYVKHWKRTYNKRFSPLHGVSIILHKPNHFA